VKRLRYVTTVLIAAVVGTSYAVGAPRVNAKSSAASPQTYYGIANIQQGAPLNFFSPSGMGGQWGPDITMAQLGDWHFGSNMFNFIPVIAKSWQVSKNGKQVTVLINSKAKWSNGKSITARDLYVTSQIGQIRGTVEPYGLANPIKIVNTHEVIYSQLSTSNYNLFLRQMLFQAIAPAAQYASLLPGDVNTTINDSQYTGSDPALQAKAKSALTTLAGLAKKIEAFNPPQNLSDGPYKIQAVSPSEIVLVKNNDYALSNKISINKLVLRNDNDDNQTIWNMTLAGQTYQMTSGGMTPQLINQMKHVSGNVFYKASSTASLQLIFNQHVAPYNNVKVRQALAYIIDRKPVWKVAALVAGSQSTTITGGVDANAKAYLTRAQLKQLNPYKKNLTTAAKLLQQAGMTKKSGKWHLSDGSQWTMTLYTVAGFNDVIEGFQNIANQLSSFGIDAQPQLVPTYAQYLQDLPDQKYAVGFWIGTSPIPYNFMARLYGGPDGYQVENGQLVHYTAADKGKGNWLNFPTSVKVKGYGNVKVGPLTYQLSQTHDSAKIRKIVQELMIATNQYVPEITMWDVIQTGFVNQKYFTNYPLKNVSVMRSCYGDYPPIGCWENFGYLQPK
jgi:peptide/nickel transport system substrate-binding protein